MGHRIGRTCPVRGVGPVSCVGIGMAVQWLAVLLLVAVSVRADCRVRASGSSRPTRQIVDGRAGQVGRFDGRLRRGHQCGRGDGAPAAHCDQYECGRQQLRSSPWLRVRSVGAPLIDGVLGGQAVLLLR